MRDIRSDLKERLDQCVRERRTLEARLSGLQNTEAGIRALLKQEEERFSGMVAPLFPEGGDRSLSKLIVHVFKTQNRPLRLEEIKGEIAKTPYDFGDKKPGRAIHFALVGLDQSGLVQRVDGGCWAIREAPAKDSAEQITH